MQQSKIELDVEEVLESYNKIQNELKLKLTVCIEYLFIEYPTLNKLKWRQYTPYYNDGDICEFRNKFLDCGINEYDEWDKTFNEEDEKLYYTMENDLKSISKIPDDIFELSFGNQVSIIIKRDGDGIRVQIDNYEDHD